MSMEIKKPLTFLPQLSAIILASLGHWVNVAVSAEIEVEMKRTYVQTIEAVKITGHLGSTGTGDGSRLRQSSGPGDGPWTATVGASPGEGVRVYNAEGEDVGPFLGWGGNPGLLTVLHERLGLLMEFDQETGEITNPFQPVYFEKDYCKGQGWIRSNANKRLIRLNAPIRLLVTGTEAFDTTIYYQSKAFASDFSCSNMAGQRTGGFLPVKEISAQQLGLPLPLTPPLRIGTRAP
jgi:hypothetical protein